MIPLQVIRSPARVVLVVDDEPSMRKLMLHVLRAHGFKALTARDATEALRIVRRFRRQIHIVVTDVEMPGMNGFELSEQLNGAEPSPAVLLISGAHSAADREVAPRLGPKTRFLSKPFNPADLVSNINELLNHAFIPGSRSIPHAQNGSTKAQLSSHTVARQSISGWRADDPG